jgi:hypothetical protein
VVSPQDVFDDVGLFYAGETLVEALKAVGEPRVIDPQAFEDGSVEVTDVDRIGGDRVAKLVGLAVRRAD